MKNVLLHKLLNIIPENNRIERIWKLSQVDFKKRYYNDKFGILWALLNPILRLLVYYFAFTFFLGRMREGIDNYALFLFAAIIFWLEFVQTMRKCIKILQNKSYLIENIKLPKMELFISIIVSSLMGFSFNIFAYFIISLYFGTSYSGTLFYLPVLIVNLYLISIGIGMILAVIYIYFKDIIHMVDILILFGFWTSGIIFPANKVVDFFEPLYYINPFLGILNNVRAILVYNGELDFKIMSINLTMGIVIYLIGVFCIKKYSYKVIEKI